MAMDQIGLMREHELARTCFIRLDVRGRGKSIVPIKQVARELERVANGAAAVVDNALRQRVRMLAASLRAAGSESSFQTDISLSKLLLRALKDAAGLK